jgi:integrase
MKLVKRNDVWHVVGTLTRDDGSTERIRRSTGTADRAAARRQLQEIMRGGESRPSRLRLREVFELYEGKGLGRNDANVVKRWKERFGDADVWRIDVAALHAWARERGIAPETFRRELTTLGAALNYARRGGLKVPVVDLLKPPPGDGRVRALEAHEVDRLLGACDESFRPLATFLFFTGARLGEALDLTWDRVEARDGVPVAVVLATRKKKGGRLALRRVPLGARVVLPERRKVLARAQRVFQTRHNDRYGWVYRHWKAACEAACIRDLKVHDARHTFATLLLRGGAHVKAVADLMGHSTLEMIDRYGHLIESDLDAVMGRAFGRTFGTHLTHEEEIRNAGLS